MKTLILVITLLCSNLSFAETNCYDGETKCTIAQMIAANNIKIEQIVVIKRQIDEASDKNLTPLLEFAGAFTIVINNLFATAVTDKSQYTKKRISIMGVSLLVSAVLIYDGSTRFILNTKEVRDLKEKLELKEKQLELENKILINVYKGVVDSENI
jgi:hypothetical protein